VESQVPAIASSIGLTLLQDLHAISTPFAAYVVSARRVSIPTRATVAIVYTALLAHVLQQIASPLQHLLLLVLGWSYLIACTIAVHSITRAFPRGVPSRTALVILLVCVFVVMPRSLLGTDAAWIQALGWEMTFAAYSYALEAAKGTSDLRTCLFFMLVNPMLVFPERGRRSGPIALRSSALLRCGGGLLSSALSYGIKYMIAVARPVPVTALRTVLGYARFMGFQGLRLIAGYAGHSGRASLQLAWMRLLGHEIPERYRYPLLARGPADFWRRWNNYTGAWARRYVFTPLSLVLRRRHPRSSRALLTSIAVLATFVVIGLAHDFVAVATRSVLGFAGTLLFALHAVALLLWSGVGHYLSQAPTVTRSSTAGERLKGVGSWLLFMHFMALTLWLGVPGPRGEGVPDRVSELRSFFSSEGKSAIPIAPFGLRQANRDSRR
jgi:hypothetical protein